MSNKDESGVNNETHNLRNSLNIHSHGYLPKWLEDISDNVIHNRTFDNKGTPTNKYQTTDLRILEDSSGVPSRIAWEVEKRKLSLPEKSEVKFGNKSLASQIYAKHMPKHIMVSKSDYLVPHLEGRIDLSHLNKDSNQADLEKSWKSLNTFQQTHKGRLDSARNELTNSNFGSTWNSSLPSLDSTSETESGHNYSPSFVDQHTPTLRSKSEMSNYVLSYPRKTEGSEVDYTNDLPIPNLSTNKSKSSENLFESAISSMQNLSQTFANFGRNNFEQQRSNIEKHLNEYKMRVDQENRLRERIINELLNENERITEKLKNNNVKNKPDNRRFSKTPTFEDVSLRKLYNKNSKYKNIPKNIVNNNFEKENLIEYFIEGGDSSFVIPELPAGKTLKMNIFTTWGDKHYVGLNGIEIFSSNGKIVDVKKISATPADVNVLPENENDPRVVRNLLDGVNRTQDDVHLWLAPFNEDSEHTVTIEFRNIVTLAMIRIWNYNKSRIHSFRGVKDVVLTLDNVPIFKGEIAKACGGILGGVDAFGDTILFTTNDEILEMISHNDKSYSTLTTMSKPETPTTTERPPTVATMANRPYTGAPVQKEQTSNSTMKDQILLGAHQIDIVLLSNWGYTNIIGLTGLEVIGISDNSISVTEDNISCNSKIKTVNLKALINGENVTTELNNMWWIPYKPGQDVCITINFTDFTYISGLRFWNYNQSPETTYAGIRTIKILLDGKATLNHLTKEEIFLLRRAPGNIHYDFVQDIHFTDNATPKNHILVNPFNTLSLYKSEMPEGFVFQFIIFSTWGDQYYCGLNGLELYNEFGEKVLLEEQNVCAYPESINILPDVSGDIRTPDKLIDGVTNDDEGAHSWLAPIIPKCLNRIYIVLDQPITVSLVKLWNYSKTSHRGIKEFAILVDDLLVYNGILEKYTKKKGAPNYRSVLFTDDKSVVERELHTFIRNSSHMQEVILLNDNRTTTGGSLPPDQTLRPFTSVSPLDRGYITQ